MAKKKSKLAGKRCPKCGEEGIHPRKQECPQCHHKFQFASPSGKGAKKNPKSKRPAAKSGQTPSLTTELTKERVVLQTKIEAIDNLLKTYK